MGPPSNLAQMSLGMGSHPLDRYLLKTSYMLGTGATEVKESDTMAALMKLTT